jgi:hypothetical protein
MRHGANNTGIQFSLRFKAHKTMVCGGMSWHNSPEFKVDREFF